MSVEHLPEDEPGSIDDWQGGDAEKPDEGDVVPNPHEFPSED